MFQTVPLSEQDYTNISRAVEALDGKRRKTENDAEKPHLLEQLEQQQQQQQQHRQNDDEFRHLLPQRGNDQRDFQPQQLPQRDINNDDDDSWTSRTFESDFQRRNENADSSGWSRRPGGQGQFGGTTLVYCEY